MSKTKQVKIGSLTIGGGAPVAVQSMTSTKTYDVEATVSQIKELEKAGCDLVRVSVPDEASVKALPEIKSSIKIPLVGDIHFKPSLALKAIEAGVDKIRINPGTIRNEERMKEIINAAGEAEIPIRIGLNSGSLPEKFEELKHKDLAKALVEGAQEAIEFFENEGFKNLVISVKASDVLDTVKAYQELSKNTGYPL
ncbi:MAG: 4-hydroxy-3-methylbut-2-en-1-yl diphosphate synthase, partial [Actinobacteria bacterium]